MISVCESPDLLHAANTDEKGIPPLIVVEAVKNNAATASRLMAAIFTLLSNLSTCIDAIKNLNYLTNLPRTKFSAIQNIYGPAIEKMSKAWLCSAIQVGFE